MISEAVRARRVLYHPVPPGWYRCSRCAAPAVKVVNTVTPDGFPKAGICRGCLEELRAFWRVVIGGLRSRCAAFGSDLGVTVTDGGESLALADGRENGSENGSAAREAVGA